MKILCSKEQLANGFKAVSSLLSSKTSTTGNQGVLIEAKDDQLLLKSSDGEVTASHLLTGVKVETPGLIMIDPVVGSLIMDLRDETVAMELQADGSSVKLTAKGKDYDAPTLDPSDFRGIESEQSMQTISLKAEILKAAVNRCAFAVAREPSRYAFHGILVEVTAEGKINFVGSDGRRLSLVSAELEEKPAEPIYALVPKRAFADFVKVVPPEGETVKISFSPARMCMVLGNTTVIAQIIEGKYPDYLGVIPKETKNRAQIPVKPLEDALKRFILISSNESPIVRMVFYSHGELEINCDQGNRAGKESLDVKIEGDGGEISLNPVFVMELLRALDREVITLNFTDNKVPAKFEGGEDLTHIVMPIIL